MKRLFLLIIFVGAFFLLAMLGGALWWNLWMTYGWPGAPGLLSKLMGAQGDGAYDAMQDEMSIIIFLVLLVVAAISRMKTRTPVGPRSTST